MHQTSVYQGKRTFGETHNLEPVTWTPGSGVPRKYKEVGPIEHITGGNTNLVNSCIADKIQRVKRPRYSFFSNYGTNLFM